MDWDDPGEAVLAGVFGDHIDTAREFARHLATSGVERGLIGPREVSRLWSRHVLNCAVVQEVLPVGARVADIGSGAGLPGLVLAIARPDLEITLVEPLQRRVIWLAEVIEALGLEGLRVHRGRADSLHGVEEFDVVTARAVASLETLGSWCLPLTRQGGHLVALKGQSAGEEVERDREALARWGGGEPEIIVVGEGVVPEPATVVRIARVGRGIIPPAAARSAAARSRTGGDSRVQARGSRGGGWGGGPRGGTMPAGDAGQKGRGSSNRRRGR